MNSPKVSVVMAVYNAADFVREALDSILSQSFTDFEVVLIEDGSSDNSLKLVSDISDPRIRILRNEVNQGLTKSLNRGIRESRGEYIARLDADDLMLPERLRLQADFLDRNPQVGLVGSFRQVIDKEGQIIASDNTPYSREEIFHLLHFRNVLIHSSVMMRRSLVEQTSGYDETVVRAQDYELWNRLSRLTQVAVIPKDLVAIRRSEKQISSQFSTQQAESVRQVVARTLMALDHQPTEQLVSLVTAYVVEPNVLTPELLQSVDIVNQAILQKEAKLITSLGLTIEGVREAAAKEVLRYLTAYQSRFGLWATLKQASRLSNRTRLQSMLISKSVKSFVSPNESS